MCQRKIDLENDSFHTYKRQRHLKMGRKIMYIMYINEDTWMSSIFFTIPLDNSIQKNFKKEVDFSP